MLKRQNFEWKNDNKVLKFERQNFEGETSKQLKISSEIDEIKKYLLKITFKRICL